MKFRVKFCGHDQKAVLDFTVDDGIISALRHRSTINEEELIMDIVCLDLEGVLVPEIWIAFAEESGIPELKKTTRVSRIMIN